MLLQTYSLGAIRCRLGRWLKRVIESQFAAKSALLWQRILRLDHTSLFSDAPHDIRDRPHGFDRLPQPGFVGRRYERGGLLLVGQNPGNDAIGKGISESDRLQYGFLIYRLGDARDLSKTVEAYNGLMAVLGSEVMPRWSIIRKVVQPLLDGLGMDLDQIAYINLIEFRNRQQPFLQDSTKVAAYHIGANRNAGSYCHCGSRCRTHREFKKLYRGTANLYKITRAIGDARLPPAGVIDIKEIVSAMGA